MVSSKQNSYTQGTFAQIIFLFYTIDEFLPTKPETQRATTAHCHECMHYKEPETSAIGTTKVVLSDALLREFAALRMAYATFLCKYKEEVQTSVEAQSKLFKTLKWLIQSADHSFQPCFETLIKKEVSLFNITYLKQACDIFPEDVW